jgi:class 3 adenylate cyclase/tetratricopeptide (TPR) repeat protein
MKCTKCQFENRDGAKFCKDCGVNLEVACSKCGTVYELGSKFCDECGCKLDLEIEVAKVDSKGGGERKYVTVLFSDLAGYTAMSERLDPEEVKAITSRIFDDVSKTVSKYDGFIEKYAGDAVMALFGAARSHEDDPVRAVRAAGEIHRLVESISPQYEDKVGQPLKMHSGINTGLVVTGELNLEKGVHGVAGDAVNVAARLSSTAKAGEILVDHETYSRTEGYFQFENLDAVHLKGKSNTVEVHKYVADRKRPQKIHRLHGLRAELVGRKDEMAQLSEAVQNLSRGIGSVFSIIGAAGTGKSRLIEEFKASLNLGSIQWREGNAFAYAQNIPYFPLIDLLSKAIHIDESDSPDTVREKLESSIDALLGDKENIVPYIGSLYSIDYPEVSEVSPEFWKSELQKAMLKVLTALAQKAPTVVCLEDLHWADPSTLELVHFLLSEIRHPVLFICVYRPIVSPFPTHKIGTMAFAHQELHLRDLSLSDAQNMVESLLKTDTVPNELQSFIRSKVEGNPFYLEEAVNSLIESHILISENGIWKVNGPIAETEMSATIQGVITARVDRLELESKRILQEASVIGRTFYYDILKRISEINDNIDRSLSGLERFNLIRTKSIEPHLEYIFKHALTQEVVYNGLLKKERREIHERIAHVIEELFTDRLPEFYETLAFHFKGGKSVHKAIKYLMKSGEKSLRRYALDESNKYYQEAFDLLTRKMDEASNKDKKLLVLLLVEWALVFYYQGNFKRINDLFDAHEGLVETIGNDENVGMFYAWLGFALYFRGKPQVAYDYLQKALKVGENLKVESVVGYASTWLPFVCAGLGLFDEGIFYGEKAKGIANAIPHDQYLYFKSRAALGFVYFILGKAQEVSENGKIILEYSQHHSNIRGQVMGYWILGFSYILEGNHAACLECFEKALQISSDPFYSQFVKMSLGNFYTRSNQIDKAEALLKEVLNFSHTYGCEIWDDWLIPDLEKIAESKKNETEK